MSISAIPISMKKIIFSFLNSNTPSSPSFTTTPTDSLTEHYPLRVSDILLLPHDDVLFEELLMGGSGYFRERGGAHRSIDYSTPRRILSRCLNRLCRRPGAKRVEQSITATLRPDFEHEAVVGRGLHSPAPQLEPSLHGSSRRDSVNSAAESGRQSHSAGQGRVLGNGFNVGAGCCLLYLIASSRNELNKMVELRMQMETFLQKAKQEELQKKVDGDDDDDEKTLSSETNYAFEYSTSIDAPESPAFEIHLSPQTNTTSDVLPESSAVTVLDDQSLKCETPLKQQVSSSRRMDRLEAELEVELQRLQLHLDTENLLEHPQLPKIKVAVMDATTTSKSCTSSSPEVIDPEAAATELQFGVSPYELERRLHEVLEARQQEEIRELETALESVKRKLREKEMEVCWWKDTARLMSQHVGQPSRLTS